MLYKVLTLVAAVALLAACETTPRDTGDASAAATGNGTATTAERLGAATPGSQEELRVEVGDRIFFDFDSSDVRSDQRETLRLLAAWLRRYPDVRLVVEGHADERGTREYNLALGERRANSVRRFLLGEGIAEGRLSTISYGKERPEALGSNEQAWAQNRRAVFVVR